MPLFDFTFNFFGSNPLPPAIVVSGDWILATGDWDDAGEWDDSAVWID